MKVPGTEKRAEKPTKRMKIMHERAPSAEARAVALPGLEHRAHFIAEAHLQREVGWETPLEGIDR